MKKWAFFITLLNITILTSCNATAIPKEISSSISKQKKEASKRSFDTGAHNLEDTTNFQLVREFIRATGDSTTVDASSIIGGGLFVTYHKVQLDSIEITIDHSKRIYLSINNLHYGNILKENGTVKPEIIYGVPDKNPTDTKAKEIIVLAYYERLINLALKNNRTK